MQAELWLLLAQCVSHPQGDARFLPYREKRKPATQGPFLGRYRSLVTFTNVTLQQTWKQHCCASVEWSL